LVLINRTYGAITDAVFLVIRIETIMGELLPPGIVFAEAGAASGDPDHSRPIFVKITTIIVGNGGIVPV
jgi:hypothetical protein